MRKNNLLCPSSICIENSILLGTVKGDGQVNMLGEEVTVDNDFIQIVKLGRKPEKRFRFANSCIEKSCVQWEKGECGLIRKLVDAYHDTEDSQALLTNKILNCPIRVSCRWYNQNGLKACRICPEIITDLNDE